MADFNLCQLSSDIDAAVTDLSKLRRGFQGGLADPVGR
jgi:hypothetical protein